LNFGPTLLLKSAAGNLGSERIVDLLLKLKLLGRTGDLADTKQIIDKLRTEFKHIEEHLKRSLSQEVALKF